MSLIFGSKKASDDTAQKKRPTMSPNERMVVAGAITVILVVVAGLVLLASGGGTPLTRCTGIVFSAQRSSCLVSLAESTTNVSVCGYLPSGQGAQCVSSIAVATNNESACDSVGQNASYYSTCVIAVSGVNPNISYCAQLSEPYRSECAYGVAAQQNFMQSASCSLIGNQTLAANCAYRNDYQSAIAHGSGSYCSSLPAGQNASLLAYMFTETPGAAGGITNITALLPFINVTPMQFCRYSVAVLTYNASACSALNGTISLLCTKATGNVYYNASVNITEQNITTICGKLPSSVQQVCSYGLLSYIALNNGNATICGQIGATQYKNACYAALAGKYHDGQYCTYITNASIMEACSSAASVSNSTG